MLTIARLEELARAAARGVDNGHPEWVQSLRSDELADLCTLARPLVAARENPCPMCGGLAFMLTLNGSHYPCPYCEATGNAANLPPGFKWPEKATQSAPPQPVRAGWPARPRATSMGAGHYVGKFKPSEVLVDEWEEYDDE